MISKLSHAASAYVWIWLPNQTAPVVAGRLELRGSQYAFTYGKSYRERENAIALSPVELPLESGTVLSEGLQLLPNCIRDALPDAWGRRLMDYQYAPFQPNELDYGLLSGSNRIGALDFQASATEYVARDYVKVNLEDIDQLANALEHDHAFSKTLAPILLHGTSVGGARPKCLLNVSDVEMIAKFSLSADYYPFLRAEYLAMRFAKIVGVSVADVKLTSVHGRDVLLVSRFDRSVMHKKVTRKIMLSGLSLLGLDEMEARYASYIALADVIRKSFKEPKAELCELYSRLALNVLMGNTDDHARNHAAFWDGELLMLTPAYDICPQIRVGYEATQAMQIEGKFGNASTLKNVLSVCEHFLLEEKKARQLIQRQIDLLDQHWQTLCEEAKLGKREQTRLWGTVIKSAYCMHQW